MPVINKLLCIKLTFLFGILLGLLISCGNNPDTEFERNRPQLNVVSDILPYQTLDEALKDIENIDWNKDIQKSAAVTKAYAANEIISHYALMGIDAQLSNIKKDNADTINIYLNINTKAYLGGNISSLEAIEQSYSINKNGKNITIMATNRIGLLYGSFRFLELEGFAWHDQRETLLPERLFNSDNYKVIESPKTKYRGFWLYNEKPLADSYLIWMAKNRFNLVGPASSQLKKLLGFRTWGGGHKLIQEVFSTPGLFELHENWFGYKNGRYHPIEKTGSYFNPSFVNPEVADYFSDVIIARLQNGDLKDVDILNVWPADRRGGVFDRSQAALEFGNDTDNILFFYKNVARNFRLAYQNGQLNRIVTLAGISYFNTWQPPSRTDVTAELSTEDYIHIFYLNERTWSSPLYDQSFPHESNLNITNNLAKWVKSSGLNFGTVDYYNYSTYAGIALNNYLNFEQDYNDLEDVNGDVVAYMHPLFWNPGQRRLTNQLLSKMTWNTNIEAANSQGENVIDDYFKTRFGVYADDVRNLYTQYADAVDNTKELYGDFSLKYNLFKSVFWGLPFEQSDIDIFTKFLEGGTRELPIIFEDTKYIETFRGLDESIIELDDILEKWQTLQKNINDISISSRVLDDIQWVESTLLRYRLTKLTVQYAMASINGTEKSVYKESIQKIIGQMEGLAVLNDTISPVNQTQFLRWSESLINNI